MSALACYQLCQPAISYVSLLIKAQTESHHHMCVVVVVSWLWIGRAEVVSRSHGRDPKFHCAMKFHEISRNFKVPSADFTKSAKHTHGAVAPDHGEAPAAAIAAAGGSNAPPPCSVGLKYEFVTS